MDTKEALKSFELDARLFYDAIAFSTDDYLYIIDMQRDIALVSDNMRDDFDLPDSLVPGSSLFGENSSSNAIGSASMIRSTACSQGKPTATISNTR